MHKDHPNVSRTVTVVAPTPYTSLWHRWRDERRCKAEGGHWPHAQTDGGRVACCGCGKPLNEPLSVVPSERPVPEPPRPDDWPRQAPTGKSDRPSVHDGSRMPLSWRKAGERVYPDGSKADVLIGDAVLKPDSERRREIVDRLLKDIERMVDENPEMAGYGTQLTLRIGALEVFL